MIYRKGFPVNCFVFAFVLLFCYFILPVTVYDVLGGDFYVFSKSQPRMTPLVVLSFFVVLLFVFVAFFIKRNVQYVSSYGKLYSYSLRFFYYITWLLLGVIFVNGLWVRFTVGAEREYLLESMHSFLFSGVSFVMVSGFLYAAKQASKNIFILFCVLLILIDLLYMGKKFSFYLISIIAFRADSVTAKPSIKPIIYLLFFGVGLVVATYLIRSFFATESVADFGVYALTSEFVGVFASTGFAFDFSPLIHSVFNINPSLEYYYLPYVGHGLAIHPVAFFYLISPDCWYILFFLFLLFVIFLLYIFSFVLYDSVVFVLMFNVIHFFRHGPDVFLQQLIPQMIFLSLLVVLDSLFKKRASLKGGIKVELC